MKYVNLRPWGWWVYVWRTGKRAGLFRNRSGVKKWLPGRLLPRRWGFYVLGLEIGQR